MVADVVDEPEPLSVGQHLYINGTGKWWGGRYFGAVVVDIRESDNTVKVQYTDLGFKRFLASELQQRISRFPLERASAPERWEEWHAASPERQPSALEQLHDDVMRATRGQDLEKAKALQASYQLLLRRITRQRDLRNRLSDAVKRGDYLEAHSLQQQMKSLIDDSSDAEAVECVVDAPDDSVADALHQAALRALGGGFAGAAAMVLQICALMWLRTCMNHQYRYGLSLRQSLSTLYKEGGVRRFYQGIGPALLQGPLARFADTAANTGVLALFELTEARTWPAWAKTAFGSVVAGAAGVALVPLDTLKVIMQVEGKQGLTLLAAKWRAGGVPVLFHGAVASGAATFVSHYPWYTMFNTLNDKLPNYRERPKQLLRNAGIGFCASVCSDAVSNSFRVVKIYRQTSHTLTYVDIVQKVVSEHGLVSLFGRGLRTRILANGVSGIMFSVAYKAFEEQLSQSKVST